MFGTHVLGHKKNVSFKKAASKKAGLLRADSDGSGATRHLSVESSDFCQASMERRMLNDTNIHQINPN